MTQNEQAIPAGTFFGGDDEDEQDIPAGTFHTS